MGRRLGDVLVLAFVLLLALGVAHRAHSVAQTRQQLTTDRTVFARYVSGLPGSFRTVTVKQRRAYDIVCARRGARLSRVCVAVRGGRVVHVYRSAGT